jgi:hypothetical protein
MTGGCVEKANSKARMLLLNSAALTAAQKFDGDDRWNWPEKNKADVHFLRPFGLSNSLDHLFTPRAHSHESQSSRMLE